VVVIQCSDVLCLVSLGWLKSDVQAVESGEMGETAESAVGDRMCPLDGDDDVAVRQEATEGERVVQSDVSDVGRRRTDAPPPAAAAAAAVTDPLEVEVEVAINPESQPVTRELGLFTAPTGISSLTAAVAIGAGVFVKGRERRDRTGESRGVGASWMVWQLVVSRRSGREKAEPMEERVSDRARTFI
jgi:hypothetical protein